MTDVKSDEGASAVEVLFDISASAARVAAICKAESDVRSYLHGILVEPAATGGAYVVGTNGYVLGACHDKTGSTKGKYVVSVHKDLLKRLPLRSTYDSSPLRLRYVRFGDAAQLQLVGRHGAIEAIAPTSELPGDYPKWRKVIPDPKTLEPSDSPCRLAYLALASKVIDNQLGSMQVVFMQAQKHGATIAFLPRHPDLIFIIMPQRPEDRDGTILEGWKAAWDAERNAGLEEAARIEEAERAKVLAERMQNAEFLTEDPDHADSTDEVPA